MYLNLKMRIVPSQRGISLIESMVAIVVMALGILGIVGVQLRTLSDTQTGVRRAQAIHLIEDLSERIKVNPNALLNIGGYAMAWGTNPTGATDCKATACTTAQIIQYDLQEWKRLVNNTLAPQANTAAAATALTDATIFIPADETVASNRRQLGVMVRWRENERSTTADYRDPVSTAATGGAGVTCDVGWTCHLQYIQVSTRCSPPNMSSGTAMTFCPQ
jgi:type IV pilus assembly protein PilV